MLTKNGMIASYVMTNYAKEDIILHLKNAKVDTQIISKVEEIIDLFKNKEK